MTAETMLRPSVAARRFGVSERTLARWAAAGLIGRSLVGRTTWYAASDIADLIARHTQARTVVPIAAPPMGLDDDCWRADPFWTTRTTTTI